MFSQETLSFLEELAAHNERSWFEANKTRYESLVRAPALDFIAAMAPELARFAPQFTADGRKVGGSLMRVFRDTRFSRDKTPYKTNIGIQFRHSLGKDVHAPGYYVHISPQECFLGVGCWHPEPVALARIRDRIAEKPLAWLSCRDDADFTAHWTLAGDSLSRPPKGYPSQHPALDDLKRKDFIGLSPLPPEAVTGDLLTLASRQFAAAESLMEFLCEALGVPF